MSIESDKATASNNEALETLLTKLVNDVMMEAKCTDWSYMVRTINGATPTKQPSFTTVDGEVQCVLDIGPPVNVTGTIVSARKHESGTQVNFNGEAWGVNTDGTYPQGFIVSAARTLQQTIKIPLVRTGGT